MSIHEDWPERPAWSDPDLGAEDAVERHFLLEVSVGQSTARVEEYHLRMEGEEDAGLVERVGPLVSFSPDDLTPEMAADTLSALTQLLERYRAAA
ncbi:MAG TPA: hypothetical protein VF885_12700 [Arthrobacter sp.]